MSEWQEFKLGELVEIGSSKRVFYEDYVNVGVPFYRSKEIIEKHNGNNISTDLFITKEKFEQIKEKYGAPKAGDLLLTSVGTLGIPYIVEEDEEFYFKDGNLTWFKNYKNNLYNQFLYYWIVSPIGKNALDMMSIGSTQAALTIQGLKNLDFIVPPIEEQKVIASVLSSLDNKIDLLHRQNTTLEAMAETLFRQWFVEEAQEDWELVLLGDLFEISSGKGLKKEQLSDTGLYPVLGANGEIGKTNDFLFNEKLIFTGRVGTLGNFFRVNNEKVWLSDNTLIFRNIKYFYFVYFTLQKAGLSDYNVGSTQPLIRQSDIKCIEILIPKKQEKLYQFETESELIFTKINSNNKQIQTLEKLRDNLLPKLMSGEVRVG